MIAKSAMNRLFPLSARQRIFGVVFGLFLVALWVVWMNWGRAAMLAFALALVPPGLVLLRYPLLGLSLACFTVTADLDSFLPRTFTISLFLTLLAVVYQKLCRGDFRWKIPPFVGWSLLFFTWMATTILWARNYDYLWFRLIVQSTILTLLISELVREPRQMRYVMYAIGTGVIFTAISSIYGIYTLFTKGLAIQAAGSVDALSTARYFGHWGGPNQLAHSVMPFVALFVPFLRKSEPLWLRGFFVSVVFCGVIAVALSLSRAAILSLTLALAVVTVASRYRWALTFSVFAALTITVAFLPVNLVGRVASFGQGRQDASFDQRSVILKAAVDMIEDSFPLGHGMGSFFSRQQDYIHSTFKVYHAHNTYLHTLLEYGVIGALLLGLAIYTLFIALKRSFKRARYSFEEQLRKALLATLLALLFSMTFETMVGWPPYWMAFALISIYPSLYTVSEDQND